MNAREELPLSEEAFHEGERAVQERVGMRGRMAAIGRQVIRDHMPEQHRSFFAQLPFLLVGGLDQDGWPWASLVSGQTGFVVSPDPHTLVVAGHWADGDPLAPAIQVGADVGMLGIELATRRRNRVNGVVLARAPERFTVSVRQSFGNCPQYIQRREVASEATADRRIEASLERADLSRAATAIIERADTFFIATATPTSSSQERSRGVDVSHRGGKPGFVRVRARPGGGAPIELVFPDFRGNFFFNTLGNLALFPRAGLLFVDFASGDLLTLTGDAEVIWAGPELDAFEGAERLVRFVVRRGARLVAAMPLRFGQPSFAPELTHTGSWASTPAASQSSGPREGADR